MFLDLTRGFDVPVGTVVALASASHLGRCGAAAYAGDVVAALGRVREAFGGNVRVVHGFPIIGGELMDEGTVRGLREIELWLAEVDKRRLCSLPRTSDYFIRQFLCTKNGNISRNTHSTATPYLTPLVRLWQLRQPRMGGPPGVSTCPGGGGRKVFLANNARGAKFQIRSPAGH